MTKLTMPEPIRLVIWDLDETFWTGTLTEGGIAYKPENHATVIELSKRGIMSSICSKNDLGTVQKILVAAGLWDYFIFPSIDWTPKGNRIASIVEAVQLRAPTILFIDDNAMNRNEALHHVPGLQVSDETIVPSLLNDPLCRGKNDHELTRLKQYKLLETRQRDQKSFGDESQFLRVSDIRVTVEHDIERHIDRVIELINRTNQLNFTKRRLPEDPEAARKALRQQLAGFKKHAGLVQVVDKYGDYGFVGFYLVRSFADAKELEHFCFSCRTLGMGVEKWLYERLGRPSLNVQGEVLTDLFSSKLVDWINQGGAASSRDGERLAGRILVRGGCSMTSTAHYLELNADEVVGEFNIVRNNMSVRTDLSRFLRYAFEGMSQPMLDAAAALGYKASDFTSALAADPSSFDVCVFSFQIELQSAEYHHPTSGFRIPFFRLLEPVDNRDNVLESSGVEHSSNVRAAIERLREGGYRYMGASAETFRDNLAAIIGHISDKTVIFFVLAPETTPPPEPRLIDYYVACNQTILDVAGGRPNTHFLNILDFVKNPGGRLDWHHFDRLVYFRLYQAIAKLLRDKTASALTVAAPAEEQPSSQAGIDPQTPGTRRKLAEVDRIELEYIVTSLYRSLLRREPDPFYLRKHCDVIEGLGLEAGIAYLVRHFMNTGEFYRVQKMHSGQR